MYFIVYFKRFENFIQDFLKINSVMNFDKQFHFDKSRNHVPILIDIMNCYCHKFVSIIDFSIIKYKWKIRFEFWINIDYFEFDDFKILEKKNRQLISKNFVINCRCITIINIIKMNINMNKIYKNLFSTITNHFFERFRPKNFKRYIVF